MKYILIASALIVAAVFAEPQTNTVSEPVKAAQLAVYQKIAAKMSPSSRPFSRIGPRIPTPKFEEPRLVDGEKRLLFSIADVRSKSKKPVVGYVRLSDQKIFLLDERTALYRPASKDPRFAQSARVPKLPESRG